MKHHRLKHAADVLCEMFCGWRLMNCYPDLVHLGSGQLEINAITGACTFNGVPIKSLSIAEEIRIWLTEDTQANNISLANIEMAVLRANLILASVTASRRATIDQHFDKEGREIRSGQFHRLEIQASSHIQTSEAQYQSSINDVEEWPQNWPAT